MCGLLTHPHTQVFMTAQMGWGVVPTSSLLAGDPPVEPQLLVSLTTTPPPPSQLLQSPRRQVVVSGWKLLACGKGHYVVLVIIPK